MLRGESEIGNDIGDLRRRQLSSERLHRTVEPDGRATGVDHRGQICVRDSSQIWTAIEPRVTPEQAGPAVDQRRCMAPRTFTLEESSAALGLTPRKRGYCCGVWRAPSRNGRAACQLVGRRSADTGETDRRDQHDRAADRIEIRAGKTMPHSALTSDKVEEMLGIVDAYSSYGARRCSRSHAPPRRAAGGVTRSQVPTQRARARNCTRWTIPRSSANVLRVPGVAVGSRTDQLAPESLGGHDPEGQVAPHRKRAPEHHEHTPHKKACPVIEDEAVPIDDSEYQHPEEAEGAE